MHAASSFTLTLRMATVSTGPRWAKQPEPSRWVCIASFSSKEPLVLESLLGREEGRQLGATLPADSAADLSHPLPLPTDIQRRWY